MPICSYCNQKIEPGTGLMLAKTTGKTFWFCSRKCEKNFSMGRDSKKRTWITKKK
jgi:large subunit ribosomal protein L24e